MSALSDRIILIIASYLAATTSLLAALYAGSVYNPMWKPVPPLVSLLSLGLWAVLVSIAFRRHGRQGFWTLLGAPAALYMPAYLSLIVGICLLFSACI